MPVLPKPFVSRLQSLLGAEAAAFFEALAAPSQAGLRVNTLKTSPERFAALSPWPLTPVPWCAAGFALPKGAQAGKHPLHDAGAYYLQEPSAMAVAEAFKPKKGELVLDLAAAPGGKATHLAALMQDTGLLITNEVNTGRARALASNLERFGVRRAVILSVELERIKERWGAVFDRVLLDAPCSGEGMFRKSDEALRMWDEKTVLGCAKRQERLLTDAADLVKPGGLLAYSTCTFAPEENEQVIARFLDARRDYTLEPVTLAGVSPGRPDWLPETLKRPELAGAARLWPHLTVGEGHFIALLKRQEGESRRLPAAPLTALPRAARRLWRSFVEATLPQDPVQESAQGLELALVNDRLMAVPAGAPDLSRLRAVRSGLWLGTLKKDRFEPSHSLALALRPHELGEILELAPHDPRLHRYLQGHPLEGPGEDGWLVITTSGFPLAWGRRARSIIKNAYPKGLRRTYLSL